MTKQPTTKAIVNTEANIQSGRSVAAIVPGDVDDAYRIAGFIIAAKMAPQSLDSQDKVLVAIMHGMEVGLTPMAACQSIAVINGTPSLWGDGLLAVVRASGLLEDFREEMEFDDAGEPIAATCTAHRAGQSTPITHTWTRAQAVKAGLWDKKGPWQQYPQRMLQMRARSWVLRDGFADVTKGLHSAEEQQDMQMLVDQGDGTYAPAPRPQRSDFDEYNDAVEKVEDRLPVDERDVVEPEETKETEPKSEDPDSDAGTGPNDEHSTEDDTPAADTDASDADDSSPAYEFIDGDGEVKEFDDLEIARQAFGQMVLGAELPMASQLWADNRPFRTVLKAADGGTFLVMRQEYTDHHGVLPPADK